MLSPITLVLAALAMGGPAQAERWSLYLGSEGSVGHRDAYSRAGTTVTADLVLVFIEPVFYHGRHDYIVVRRQIDCSTMSYRTLVLRSYAEDGTLTTTQEDQASLDSMRLEDSSHDTALERAVMEKVCSLRELEPYGQVEGAHTVFSVGRSEFGVREYMNFLRREDQ